MNLEVRAIFRCWVFHSTLHYFKEGNTVSREVLDSMFLFFLFFLSTLRSLSKEELRAPKPKAR